MTLVSHNCDRIAGLLDSGIFMLADRRRLIAILERIGLIMLAGTAGIAVTAFYMGWYTTIFVSIVALMGIFLGLTAVRADHARLSAMILLVTLYASVAIGIYLADGMHDVAMLLFPLVLLLGSFLLNLRAYVVLTILCIAAPVATGLGELLGIRVYDYGMNTVRGDILIVVVLLTTVAVLVRTLAGVITESMLRVRRSERNYREIFDATREVIIVHDAATARILDVNRAGLALLGYTKEVFLKLSVADFSRDAAAFSDAVVLDLMRKTVEEGLQTFEWCARRRDGREIWLEINLHATEIDGQSRVLAVGRDIDRRKRMAEQLRQGEKMEAVGLLAGGIAHDFNNQLTGIIGYADLLLDGLDESEHDLRDNVNGIMLAANRSAKLTEQLLAFARKAKHESRPVDLHQLVEEVISLLKRSIDKRIRIERHLMPTPIMTVGDVTQLQNAILNLAINARDAMPSGGTLTFVSDRVTVDATAAREEPESCAPGHYVVLKVCDTGIGIARGLQGRIFEPFYTTKPEGQGTGMGLSAVYGTIQNHGGSIKVASEIGSGATFTMLLPLYEGEAAVTDHRQPIDGAPKAGLRVLFVDDESNICRMATRLIEALDGTVIVCRDGIEAEAYYRQAGQTIDVVVLDMVMPRMGGTETFHRLREINPDVPIVLTSGFTMNHEVQALLNEGASGFLQKPFRKDDLYAALSPIPLNDDARPIPRKSHDR